MILPDSLNGLPIEEIAVEAFLNCDAVIGVTVPASIRRIGAHAFAGCGNLSTITYLGTLAEWNAIAKDGGWDDGTPDYAILCTDGFTAK